MRPWKSQSIFYDYGGTKLAVVVLGRGGYLHVVYRELNVNDGFIITAGIRASMEWLDDNRHLSTLFQFAATEERFAPALRRGQEIALADAVKHVKDGIVAGEIRDGEPEVLAHAMLGVINHLVRELIHVRGEQPGEVADAAVAFCLGGLS